MRTLRFGVRRHGIEGADVDQFSPSAEAGPTCGSVVACAHPFHAHGCHRAFFRRPCGIATTFGGGGLSTFSISLETHCSA